MADETEDVGALGAVYGGKDAAGVLAYGVGGPPGLPPQLSGALANLLDPERGAEQERNAYWAGILAPNKSGTSGEQMGNAMKSQLEARESQDKLKAAYIPVIMQTLAQQRANELAYAKFQQDRLKELNPLINSALYGLQADGKPVSLQQAHERINQVGMQYGLRPQELHPHHYALAAGAGPDGRNLPQYLQQLRVAAAPAAEGIPKFGTNAAGQTTVQNPVASSVALPGAAQGSGEGGVGPNPTASTAKVAGDARGDVKTYTEGMHNKVTAYHEMLQRLNAIGDSLSQFQPGRYAGVAGGFAAAVKDLTARFPNASGETLRNFANAILGPNQDGKGDPVAAARFAEMLKVQEGIAQTKAMIEGQGNRLGQQEVLMVTKAMPSSDSDPIAYKKFIEFMRGQSANAMNKYRAWAKYVESADPAKLNVHSFDVPWEAKMAEQLQAGKFGELEQPGAKPAAAPAAPAAPTPAPAPPRAAPAAPAAAPATGTAPDLRQYEPGARVGPTGKVYVLTKDGPRAARRVGGQ